jgi:hypothetical protein
MHHNDIHRPQPQIPDQVTSARPVEDRPVYPFNYISKMAGADDWTHACA